MRTLLYIRLVADNQSVPYESPVLAAIKKLLPGMPVLDIDSHSDELVLHFARQLLQQPAPLITVIDSDTPDAGLGSINSLLEMLLEAHKEHFILFRNSHNRLQRMIQARLELNMQQTKTDAELLQQIMAYYTSSAVN